MPITFWLPVSGGTGLSSYTVGDLIYASATTTLAKLADVATGSVLSSGGVGVAPAWTTTPTITGTNITGLSAANISAGTLAVARGGTGTTTQFTTGSVVFAGASGVYTQDNANLFWDDTNNRLGIGETSPQASLHITHATAATLRTTFTTTSGACEWVGYENATFMGGLGLFGSAYATTNWRNALVITAAVNDAGSIIFRTRTSNAYVERLTVTNAGVFTYAEAANFAFGTSTGTKIGTATTQKLSLWNATPIIQPASVNQAILSLDVDVTGADTVDKAAINTNFTALQTLVNQLRADLIAVGIIKGAA
jgi:hypothetical protein